MGHLDSCAQLERIVVEGILHDFKEEDSVLSVYNDNLYHAVKEIEAEKRTIRFIAANARAMNLKFGSSRVGVAEILV